MRLGGMREGRKSIIFVSEGLTSSVPAQINDPVAALPGVGNPARNQPGVDQTTNPRVEAQKFFDSADLTSRIKEAFDIVNRNNCSIYAVDPRGLAAFEFDVNQGVSLQTDRSNLTQSIDSLRVLADNTDGRAIVNRNDLAAGMKQIMRDASGYYLLGYTSTAAPTDGKFHSIDVRVKRPGVEIRSRKGYWAYTAEDVARATAPPKPGPPPEISNALNAIAEPATSGHAARFWTGMEQADGGQSRVTFVWEPFGGSETGRAIDLPRARDADRHGARRPSGLPRAGRRWPPPDATAAARRHDGIARQSWRQRVLHRRARSDRDAHRRPERARPGDRFDDAVADRAGLREDAGLVRHAARSSARAPRARCCWSATTSTRRRPRRASSAAASGC